MKDLSGAHAFKHFAAQVNATFGLGQAYHSLGDYPTAIQHLRRNLASLPDDMARERFDLPGLASVLSRAWLVWCLAERGDFAEAGPLATEARTIAEFDGDAYSRVVADLASGGLQLVQGHVAAALPSLMQSLLLAEEHGIKALLPVAGALLGRGHLAAGRAADALPALERAVKQASTAGFLANQPLRLAWLGEAHLLIGQARRADDIARQAYELARAQGERGHEAYAGRLMGSVARHRAEPHAAEGAYQAALALAEKLGMRPLVAHCYLGLGRVYRRSGDRAKAREYLATATMMYREMEMAFYLARAEGLHSDAN